MLTLSELGNRQLAWLSGGGLREAFVLRADGEVIGGLQFESESRAVGELDGRAWILECHECKLHQNVLVHLQSTNELVATFTQKWTGGGIVTFESGVRYCWNPTHVWSTSHCFRREGQAATVCMVQGAPSRKGSKVLICADASRLPETPVLILLGGFLEVLLFERLATVINW